MSCDGRRDVPLASHGATVSRKRSRLCGAISKHQRKREASEASAVEASGNRAVQAYPTLSSSPRLFPPSLSNHIVGPPPQRDFGSAHPTWTASDAHACFAAQMHGAWRRSDSSDPPSLPPSHTSPQLAIGPSVLAILPSSPHAVHACFRAWSPHLDPRADEPLSPLTTIVATRHLTKIAILVPTYRAMPLPQHHSARHPSY